MKEARKGTWLFLLSSGIPLLGLVLYHEYLSGSPAVGMAAARWAIALLLALGIRELGIRLVSRNRKRVENVPRLEETLLRHMAMAGFIVDSELNVVVWNQDMATFSGVAGRAAMGRSLADMLPLLQGTIQLEDYHDVLRSGSPLILERKADPLHDQIRYMCVRLLPLYDTSRGQVERVLTLLEDITEITKIEDVLIQRNTELAARNAVAAAIGQYLELPWLLEEALAETLRVARLDVGSIYLYEAARGGSAQPPAHGATGLLTLQTSVGLSPDFTANSGQLSIDGDRVLFGLTADRRPLTATPPELVRIEIAERMEGVVAREMVPLVSRQKLQGIMVLGSRSERNFTPHERDLFASLGQQIGLTIENLRLFAEERQARQVAEDLAVENARLLEETQRAYEQLRVTRDRLIEAEKQAAVVELAGAAAHELRQPLTYVMGNLSLLVENEGLDGKTRKVLTDTLEGTHRMEGILRKIGKVTRYTTKPYVGDIRIVDLDQASTPSPTSGETGPQPTDAS
jgi:GAF domain-containing protein/PAS domain-containing protein